MIRKQNKYIFNKPCHCYLSSQMSMCCRCVDCRVENSRGNNLNYEPNANIKHQECEYNRYLDNISAMLVDPFVSLIGIV
jgi:hypothetical protein